MTKKKTAQKSTPIENPTGEITKRESIWNIAGNEYKAPFIPEPPEEEIPKPSQLKVTNRNHKVFFVHLTSWNGVPFLVRYNTAEEFPMEPAEAGGTYIFYGHKIFYVEESRDEVNAKILLRLQQIHKNWVA